jgi:O-succinylbenzoate synthase
VRVYAIAMTTRFRGITVREGALVEGAAGWGEWSPFVEYPPEEAEAWLRCAEEAAAGDWPEPVRERRCP